MPQKRSKNLEGGGKGTGGNFLSTYTHQSLILFYVNKKHILRKIPDALKSILRPEKLREGERRKGGLNFCLS